MNHVSSFFIFLALFCSNTQAQMSNGTGEKFDNSVQCLSDNERLLIFDKLDENITALGLGCIEESKVMVKSALIFPLSMPSSPKGYFNFYGISGYVDHDRSSRVQDYKCLSKTYDGHKGTDYYTFPYKWYLYENDLVHVISAAPGTIILKQDGRNDTHCSPMGKWNAVYIRHADGSVLWYGHMKAGSLTKKKIGNTVEAGEYLGVVASSGYSSGPHLHLEYYDKNKKLLDPYQGICNNIQSHWENQRPHINPQVNAILTHKIQPSLKCTNEIVGLANTFYIDDDLFVGVYITDYVAKMIAATKIYRPDNTVYDAFDTYNNENSYGWFWNGRKYKLQESDPGGTWTIECQFNGNMYRHNFEYINEIMSIQTQDISKLRLFPNPSKGTIVLKGVDLEKYQYQIIDNSGIVIQQSIIINNEIDLAISPNGLYYLSIKNNGSNYLKKFILQRE